MNEYLFLLFCYVFVPSYGYDNGSPSHTPPFHHRLTP